MIVPQLNDSLIQTFDTCATHVKRMEFAKSKVKAFIPLKSFSSIYTAQDTAIHGHLQRPDGGFADEVILHLLRFCVWGNYSRPCVSRHNDLRRKLT